MAKGSKSFPARRNVTNKGLLGKVAAPPRLTGFAAAKAPKGKPRGGFNPKMPKGGY